MGAKASVVPVFAAEVAPAHIRGSLVMNWQLFDVSVFHGMDIAPALIFRTDIGIRLFSWIQCGPNRLDRR